MKFPTSPRYVCAHRRLAAATAAAALLIPLAIGCASPGTPRPPSLRLPQVVNNLTASRVGDGVELHWTTPFRTTDDLGITGPLTAEICRETRATTSVTLRQSSCVSVERLPVHPGPSQATDPLPPALTRDPVAQLAYRIQIFNANGHSAGLSPEAISASGTAPPPVEHLRATLTRPGVQLEWQSQAAAFPVELDRLLVPQPAPKATTKPATQPKPIQPLNLTPPVPTEVRLQALNQPADAGGTIDSAAQRGQTYRYTAQRVRKITLAGHALELRSLPSPAITVAMRDTFPPAPPTGLAAIPGGTGPADRSIDLSIDLSWESGADLDIAGYIVYRQPVAPTGALTGQPQRLTPTPVPGPAFRDRTAVPGQTYAYRVTAIDTTGNESAPSADVQETLSEQQREP